MLFLKELCVLRQRLDLHDLHDMLAAPQRSSIVHELYVLSDLMGFAETSSGTAICSISIPSSNSEILRNCTLR